MTSQRLATVNQCSGATYLPREMHRSVRAGDFPVSLSLFVISLISVCLFICLSLLPLFILSSPFLLASFCSVIDLRGTLRRTFKANRTPVHNFSFNMAAIYFISFRFLIRVILHMTSYFSSFSLCLFIRVFLSLSIFPPPLIFWFLYSFSTFFVIKRLKQCFGLECGRNVRHFMLLNLLNASYIFFG